MKLYNTLSRSIEEFKPQAAPAVSLYVCGPTVYDIPHIGHARSAYTFDLLRRYLEFKKYKVTFVRNVTDVDDKIIDKAKQEAPAAADLNAACKAVAEKYLKSYHETMDRLGIKAPDIEPKATEHVTTLPKGGFGSMTDLIGKLLTQGVAYEAKGDVYFAVRKFPGYGKLSNRTLDELQAGSRVEPGEGKEDPMDFALWKAAKPGEPSWKSPWGTGRPGWHIECSAMSTHYLGDSFDIHGGGVDLVFPHHENEVAQAQAAGKPFARYWVHNGLLTVNGEKMSKSLKNYTTVEDALRDAWQSADVIKVLFLGSHYRSPLDYTPETVKAARKRFTNLFNFFYVGRHPAGEYEPIERDEKVEVLEKQFVEAMDNDLNTPEALAALDQIASYIAQLLIDAATTKEEKTIRTLHGRMRLASDAIFRLGQVLGLKFKAVEIPEAIKALARQREEARKRKDYKKSDQLRQQIVDQGYVIEDTPKGWQLIPKQMAGDAAGAPTSPPVGDGGQKKHLF